MAELNADKRDEIDAFSLEDIFKKPYCSNLS
jgi:hypothetical protein